MEVGGTPERDAVERLLRETSREHVAADARLGLRHVDVAWKLEAVRTTIPLSDDPARKREEEHPKSGVVGGGDPKKDMFLKKEWYREQQGENATQDSYRHAHLLYICAKYLCFHAHKGACFDDPPTR